MSEGERRPPDGVSGSVRARRPWLLVTTAVLMIAGLAPGAWGAVSRTPGTSLVTLAYLLLSVGGLYGWRRLWHTRRGRLEARAEGLFLDGALVVPRQGIRHAYATRDRDGALVLRLSRGDMLVRSFDVAIASEEAGAELLAALRLDPAHSRAEYAMVHGSLRRYVGVFGGAYAALLAVSLAAGRLLLVPGAALSLERLLAFYAVLATLLGLLVAVSQRLTPNVRVAIGADGVHLRRGRRTTFHPYASITGARTTGVDVELTLTDGSTVVFHHQSGTRLGSLSDRGDDARHVVARIEERLAARRVEPAMETSALARHGRAVRDWLRETAAARDSAAGFRTNALPAEQLWRLVEDAGATASERAGAALALRHELDDGARARLRVAADACAAPHLRVALEQVADAADDDQLAEAFEPLVDEARTTPMRTMSK